HQRHGGIDVLTVRGVEPAVRERVGEVDAAATMPFLSDDSAPTSAAVRRGAVLPGGGALGCGTRIRVSRVWSTGPIDHRGVRIRWAATPYSAVSGHPERAGPKAGAPTAVATARRREASME